MTRRCTKCPTTFPRSSTTPAHQLHGPGESTRYRYCTNFVVIGQELDRDALVARLEELGDSVLVVGDERTLAFTSTPTSRRASPRGSRGSADRRALDVADMHEQTEQRSGPARRRAARSLRTASPSRPERG